MRKSRYSGNQIISILKRAEAGTPVPELCRERGMSSATFYKWRAKYGGMDASWMARIKAEEPVSFRCSVCFSPITVFRFGRQYRSDHWSTQ